MPSEDDESSLQWQRLLASADTTSNSLTCNPHPPESWAQGLAPDSLSLEHSVDNAFDGDPDGCYSWLKLDQDTNLVGHQKSESGSSGGSSWSISSLPLPPPPDGGWGWFVVLGAFVVSLICDGLAFCFGVLYSELLEQFQESKSKTSLLGSIFFGVPMIMGPLASSLTTRFGCRKMTIFGGLLSSFGFILSYFANSIEMLCFTFSVVVGAGFSFCYITSVVIVAFYFGKRRALATGLAVCGTGVGTFSFAPLMDYLITEYGWRGLFLIMAGISLNLVVCGMLFRPLKYTNKERCQIMLQEFNKIPHSRADLEMGRSRLTSEGTEVDAVSETFNDDVKALSVLSIPTYVAKSKMEPPSFVLLEALRNSRNPHHTLQRYMKNAMMRADSMCGCPKLERKRFISEGTYTITTSMHDNEASEIDSTIGSLHSSIFDDNDRTNPKCQIKAKDTKPTYKGIFLEDKEGNQLLKPVITSVDMSVTKKANGLSASGTISIGGHPMKHHFTKNETKTFEKRVSKGWHVGRHGALGIHLPLFRSDIFYRRLARQTYPLKQCMLGTSCPELVDSANQDSDRGFFSVMISSLCAETADILKSMVDLNLFRNPFFVIFTLSNFIFYFWSDVPYMYAADHAINNGVSQHKAAFILSVIGIFNTVGQVVFGYFGDLNINLLVLLAIVSAFAGVAVVFVPIVSSYWSVCVVYALFGFFVSVNFPLATVLLVRYLGMERLTSAYGLLMLVQGIANFFGPPFAGWVSDVSGSYNLSFYLSGFFYVVAAMVLFLMYIPGLTVSPFESEHRSEIIVSPPESPTECPTGTLV